jgi:hypothetical protein
MTEPGCFSVFDFKSVPNYGKVEGQTRGKTDLPLTRAPRTNSGWSGMKMRRNVFGAKAELRQVYKEPERGAPLGF